MKKKITAFLLIVVAVVLCGCAGIYTAEDIEEARQQGYNEGYSIGYDRGAANQFEKDCEEFLIDGTSITDVATKVYEKYGITPDVAFSTYEQYNDDPVGSGITLEQYQEAIDAMYYAAFVFPICWWN